MTISTTSPQSPNRQTGGLTGNGKKQNFIQSHLLKIINRLVLFCSTLYIGLWVAHGLFRCPFIVPFVSCQNCPVLSCPGQLANTYWSVWGIWLLIAIFFGRAFCGRLCPVALWNRLTACRFLSWLNPTRKFLNHHEKKISWLRWVVFLGCICVVLILDQPRLAIPIRTSGNFFHAAWLTLVNAELVWQIRFSVIVFFLAINIFMPSAFCRFICPFGSVLELSKRFSVVKFFQNKSCNHCQQCSKACPMTTQPNQTNCTNCGDCVGTCHSNSIQFGKPQND